MHRALCATLILVGASLLQAVSPIKHPGAAFIHLQVLDPLGGKSTDATIFYPTPMSVEGPTQLGPYRIEAAPGQPCAKGLFPLVTISHGHAGSRFGHHNLATFLARQGFIVASLDHPGDNHRDLTGFGTDAVLLGRPLQVSALIDATLAHPLIGSHVDATRIGAMGFSAGGYTTLLLAGAWPKFELVKGYCQRHPEDQEICSLGDIRRTHPEITHVADPRVKAIFAMAPLGVFFDKVALRSVRVPVFLYAAEKDQVLLVDENASHVRDCLPRPPEYRMVPGAGHYVFLAPTPALQATLPALFQDPPGVDRAAIQTRIEQDALAFFSNALAAPLTTQEGKH